MPVYMAIRQLKTAAQVIEACGGTAAVAKRHGYSLQAVSNWKARNKIADDTYATFQDDLKKTSCRAPRSLWGMREPAAPRARAS
jgi:hypothetical protein